MIHYLAVQYMCTGLTDL